MILKTALNITLHQTIRNNFISNSLTLYNYHTLCAFCLTLSIHVATFRLLYITRAENHRFSTSRFDLSQARCTDLGRIFLSRSWCRHRSHPHRTLLHHRAGRRRCSMIMSIRYH